MAPAECLRRPSKYDNFVVRAPQKQREKCFANFFAKGVFFLNENDSLVSKTRIADPAAVKDYYVRAM